MYLNPYNTEEEQTPPKHCQHSQWEYVYAGWEKEFNKAGDSIDFRYTVAAIRKSDGVRFVESYDTPDRVPYWTLPFSLRRSIADATFRALDFWLMAPPVPSGLNPISYYECPEYLAFVAEHGR